MDTRTQPTGAADQTFEAMGRWFDSALGRYLLDVESRLLESTLARRFGYHLLELSCADVTMHGGSPIGHKFSFAPNEHATRHQAVAKAEAIPLATESVDLVLLHHALDFSDNQHQLLREASRIVISGGDIVIVGFNPYSIWGLRRKLDWHKREPWTAWMLSPIRLTDWLKLLDFQVEQIQYGVYSLPVNRPRLLRYFSSVEKAARRLNWPTGGIYVITAKKQVLPLIPAYPQWKKSPVRVGVPAARNLPGAFRHSKKKDS